MNLQFAHQRLKNSQNRFLALFERSPLSTILFSPTGYIRDANQAFVNLFDISADDLIAKNFNIMESKNILVSQVLEPITMGFTQKFVELPEAILFHDGIIQIIANKETCLRCYIYPIKDDSGDIIEVVMLHKDISDQIHAKKSLIKFNFELEKLVEKRTLRLKAINEELIRSKIREEAAMRAKEEFFANVSHELRTPLTAIKEASTMLHQGLYAGQPRKQHDLFSIVKNECERLIQSVNSILDVSSIQTGIETYHFESSNITSILQKSITNLTPIAQKKKINLSLSCNANIPHVFVDKEKINRVMVNLIGNALKFTPEAGKIIIKTHYNTNEMFHIKVSVSDNGRGIPNRNLDKIFDKFKQITQKTIKPKGSGLGLYIVRNIILDHKGDIWAESTPGKGTTFYFTLPVAS